MNRQLLLAIAIMLASGLAACAAPDAGEPTAVFGSQERAEATFASAATSDAQATADWESAKAGDAVQMPSPDTGGVPSIENLPLPSSYAVDGSITLVGGQAEEPLVAGSASTLLVRRSHVAAIGDFDADGRQDMAFVLVSMPGGSGTFYDLYVVLNEADGPRALEPVLLGDRIEPQSVTAAGDGSITVSYLDRGPDEPMAAEPTVPMRRTFAIEDGVLVETDSSVNVSRPEAGPTPTP